MLRTKWYLSKRDRQTDKLETMSHQSPTTRDLKKGPKYTLLLDGGLCKRVPIEDLFNNSRPSPCMFQKATKWA